MPKRSQKAAAAYAAQSRKKKSSRKKPVAPQFHGIPAATAEAPGPPVERPPSGNVVPFPARAASGRLAPQRPALEFDSRYLASDLKKIAVLTTLIVVMLVVLALVLRTA